MKVNNNKKGSNARKLIPAVGMLSVSAVMLATSTYAWFTMNKEVTVTGMALKTKVSGNLLVCGDNVEANYAEDLIQLRSALLEPVSTVSGVDGSFYYTVHANADGDAISDSYINYNESVEITGTNGDAVDTTWTRSSTGAGKTKVDATFNNQTAGTDGYVNSNYKAASPTTYDNAYGYVDYVFYLKATADGTAATTNQEIRLTECNLIRNDAVITDPSTPSGVTTDDDLAWRVAIFAEDITNTHAGDGDETTAVTATGDSPKIILTRSNAANHSDTGGKNYAVSGASAAPTEMSLGYNTWASSNAYIDKISVAGATKYYKVVARVWLEGEDTSCKSSTYALLTNAYEFGMQFEMVNTGDTAKPSVTSISSSISDDTGTLMAGGGTAVVDEKLGSYVVSNSSGTITTTKGGVAATIPSSGYTYKIGGAEKTYSEVQTAISALSDGETLTVVVEATA